MIMKKYILKDIIDWFGNDTRFSNESDDAVDVSVMVNEENMFFWAMQYGEHIEILEPTRLREQIKDAALAMLKKYN